MKCPNRGSENIGSVLHELEPDDPLAGLGFLSVEAKDGKFLNRCKDCGYEFTEKE